MTLNDMNAAFESYCQIVKQDPTTLRTDFRYITYLRVPIRLVIKMATVDKESEAQEIISKTGTKVQNRVRNLLSVHAEALYHATQKRSYKVVDYYYAAKTYTMLPIAFGVLFLRERFGL